MKLPFIIVFSVINISNLESLDTISQTIEALILTKKGGSFDLFLPLNNMSISTKSIFFIMNYEDKKYNDNFLGSSINYTNLNVSIIFSFLIEQKLPIIAQKIFISKTGLTSEILFKNFYFKRLADETFTYNKIVPAQIDINLWDLVDYPYFSELLLDNYKELQEKLVESWYAHLNNILNEYPKSIPGAIFDSIVHYIEKIGDYNIPILEQQNVTKASINRITYSSLEKNGAIGKFNNVSMMVRYEKEGKETYDYGKIECLLISQDSISYGKIKSQYPLTKLIITEIFNKSFNDKKNVNNIVNICNLCKFNCYY